MTDKIKELKTLKDLYLTEAKQKRIKAEAVKWVKKDKERISRMLEPERTACMIILRKWMVRFNLTEEDLK